MEPTSDRVKDNILALPSILDDIIAAEGCTIREFSHINNSGKRFTKLNGAGYMKKKPQKKDRKSTNVLRPCHSDLQPALDLLIGGKATRYHDFIEQLDAQVETADDAWELDDVNDNLTRSEVR